MSVRNRRLFPILFTGRTFKREYIIETATLWQNGILPYFSNIVIHKTNIVGVKDYFLRFIFKKAKLKKKKICFYFLHFTRNLSKLLRNIMRACGCEGILRTLNFVSGTNIWWVVFRYFYTFPDNQRWKGAGGWKSFSTAFENGKSDYRILYCHRTCECMRNFKSIGPRKVGQKVFKHIKNGGQGKGPY